MAVLNSTTVPDEEIRTVIGILDTNTYQVLVRSSPTIQDFVCGLYLRTSRLNHSCKPNTRPVFGGMHTAQLLYIDYIEVIL